MQADEEWLRALRARCEEVGAVLIFDEIQVCHGDGFGAVSLKARPSQCGLGRTGKLWAHSWYPKDCHPDMITLAKPLANGFPIGAIMMKDSIADVIKLGDHGTTFGGAPLQTRVAHHVLSRISEPSFLQHVNSVSAYLREKLVQTAAKYPSLVPSPVRGRGLMLGMPLANAHLPGQIAEKCRERGVLVLTCGRNTLRFVPSLIVKEPEVDQMIETLDAVMAELASSQ